MTSNDNVVIRNTLMNAASTKSIGSDVTIRQKKEYKGKS